MFWSILVWVLTGAVAGYIASLILKTERQGCFINIGLGIVGAFVGTFVIRYIFPALFNLFGEGPIVGIINQIVHATFGAVIVLILYELIMPGKQLGVRKDKPKRRRRR
ncbi:MAG: GlsB/YeaQ/YmgE family stress response membrane protein [Anaerolineae bacterium]|nr:GlsB/YeaQ/YmgE family stress response membrane protein [Anaerolineae bacterium]